jgi:hypothetical protein
MAGVIPIDPRPFSFWEVLMMKEGAERERWDRLSLMTSSLVNCHVKERVKWQSFHKYEFQDGGRGKRLTSSSISGLRHLFPNKEKMDEKIPDSDNKD